MAAIMIPFQTATDMKPTDYDEIAGIAIVYGVAAFRHMHELGKPAMKAASRAGIT